MPILLLLAFASVLQPQTEIRPVRTEVVTPIHEASFNKGGAAKKRIQGGNPHVIDGHLLFEGSSDGDRQVDPQIAVGGGCVLHGTNGGLVIYDKKGNYVDGVPQSEFNNGIDPKLFFDPNNRVFGFDMWVYWDKEKVKPVNVSVSETSDPRGAWNTYPVSASQGVDGGGIGFSRKWIAYSFPGGPEQTFVMKMSEVKAGKPATVYHFAGSLGQAVYTQDPMDDLVFVKLTDRDIVITTVGADRDGNPVVKSVVTAPHNFRYFGWPPASPMKGTDLKTASGDRNPKNIVLQNRCIWFSHTVDIDGRAGIEWHQVRLNGQFVQNGLLADPVNSFIQTTLAVNRRNDVLVGFQETGPDMFISPRCAWRLASDPPGTLRAIFDMGEGLAATKGGPWGDYSGSVVDGDNLSDLWTIQSIATADGRGGTVIMQVHP
ncbi:MAG TPA: hypothetical protein VMI31_03240 [Fimbriimonadaceae bacterium]|nr:hypothetical protein [Fimbriimonadaceae bacterium]